MLFDSNIIIYSTQQQHFEAFRFLESITQRSVSIVSYIEAFGYQRLLESERRSLEHFLQNSEILPLTQAVADQAVSLRRQRRMGWATR